MNDLFDLSGKTALVTGARGYLGSALSAALAEAGCRVIVSSRDRAGAEACAAGLPTPAGQRHLGVALDYTEAASIDTLTDERSRSSSVTTVPSKASPSASLRA